MPERTQTDWHLDVAVFVITHRQVHIRSISIPQVTYQLSRYLRNVDIAQQSPLLVAVSVYDFLAVSRVMMREHWCHCSRQFFHCVYHRDPIELSIMTGFVRKYSCTRVSQSRCHQTVTTETPFKWAMVPGDQANKLFATATA